jgi:hypothetical protein
MLKTYQFETMMRTIESYVKNREHQIFQYTKLFCITHNMVQRVYRYRVVKRI